MVTRRAGKSTLGCLFTLLILSAVGYFGVNVGQVYLRYYRFRDAVRQEIRFAERRTDEQIAARLRSKADSLSLPPEAQRVRVRRTPRRITITTEYSEMVELPLVLREFPFRIEESGAR